MKKLSLATAVIAIAIGACNRAPDPSAGAEKALKDANLADVKVDWDSDARVAHLKGTVDSPTDRQRAEDVASAAVGTTGKVLNEVTIKGVNDRSAGDFDTEIKRTLKRMINDDPILRDRDIDVDVNNGAVTIKGEVRSAAEKSKVTQLAQAAPGVKDMVNALEIKPPK
jgi:hyperosmotically inducible periplasmic protein